MAFKEPRAFVDRKFQIRRLLSFWSCYMLLHVRSSVSLHESKKVVIAHTLRPKLSC
jgi:hypothetical protein